MEARRGETDISQWGADAAARYAVAKHGPDGARFLDPHLYALMTRERLGGMDFADLGAGTGPWSKYAHEQGAATVTALELNPAMLAKAAAAFADGEGRTPSNVRLVQGTVAQLPFEDRSFDRLASINVGCNLPAEAFQAHFTEARRVARIGGRFVVTAPDSLLVPFTNGEEGVDIQKELDGRWASEAEHSPQSAKRVIDGLGSVLRATFVLDATGKPVLVTQENAQSVRAGTPIIRRIPGLAVDNNFHTGDEYIEAAERAGWTLNAVHRDSFGSEEARREHNTQVGEGKQLGPEYISNPSFLVMDLERRA